ncbi:exodeoxyribonuclease VII small subunit [Streptococcus pluranimalium]|uniref:exodeoxyribonuclease VII small subunit n=1 Tax=Streptococcus hyovaginalis TaxID=149015 RepID=UPI0014794675|nr:exodeoxyribonuclease VII small subunit [Streptococcus hyovaginalis]MDY3024783.1 exodeoxyribonuclease VII small subunit [Streptococcus hyovaginalis]MDY4510822.1 exodeoxyribonuclease VII small subunit [Streptococcus hyovaginalis]MDY5973357.1 exodeoxyribonuclease VII small subunit [Streptococcus hyovaginalis]
MPSKQKTFEENLNDLETIVAQLEGGDVPLEKAIEQFQKGMTLSKELQKTLQDAEKTLVKVMQPDGSEVEMDT